MRKKEKEIGDTKREKDRQVGRQTDRLTDRRTGRQTDKMKGVGGGMGAPSTMLSALPKKFPSEFWVDQVVHVLLFQSESIIRFADVAKLMHWEKKKVHPSLSL